MTQGPCDVSQIGKSSKWVKTLLSVWPNVGAQWTGDVTDEVTYQITRPPGVRDCPEEGQAGPKVWGQDNKMGREQRLEG